MKNEHQAMNQINRILGNSYAYLHLISETPNVMDT